VDVMLSFPSQITILAVVGLLGSDLRTVVLVTVLIKWAWYARMIRSSVIKFREQDFIAWSRSIGSGNLYILFRHIIPGISGELAVLATLETGWAVLNISTLSFLGLGVQAPVPEWGAMLSEAKNVMTFNPFQMLPPGLALMSVVLVCNLLGDSLRDLLDVREAGKR
ncbi:MAG: ABC transporter permease subunit, partial [Spirochaetales bacterium]|nr:ABC transporter permease subunit [Spirochaetales bacterium]